MYRLIRISAVAAAMASMGVWGWLYGAIACIVIGAICSRFAASRSPIELGSEFAQFRTWFLCIVVFVVFALLLIPFTFPAVPLGLFLFSPVFGTIVFIIERSISGVR